MSSDLIRPFRTWLQLASALSACSIALAACSSSSHVFPSLPDGGSEAGADENGGSNSNGGSHSGGGSGKGGSGSNSAGAGAISGDAGAIGEGGEAGQAGTAGGGDAECTTGDDCPGVDTECSTRTCAKGKCGVENADNGFVLSTQTAGDCQQAVCNGDGGVTSRSDNTDKPDDGNVCVLDACTNGVPSHTNASNTATCGTTAQFKCDGHGVCGGCTQNSDCGVNNLCATYACTAGICQTTFVPNGQGNLANTPMDCQKNVCNGMGSPITIADASDLPNDNNECTKDVCTNGTPSHSPEGTSKACKGGGRCDGNNGCFCADPCGAASCGTMTDVCGQARTCTHQCTMPETCSAVTANVCGCVPHPVCHDHCGGGVPDGCGHTYTCPGDSSVCNSGCGACNGLCFNFDYCGCDGIGCS